MNNPYANLSDEKLQERLEAYQRLGSYAAVAHELGINESSVRRSLSLATRRNLTGAALGGPMPHGYTLGKITSYVTADGTVAEWQHKLPEDEALQDMVDELIETMKAGITPLEAIDAPDSTVESWLTLYPVVDVHLGMYAWAKESGENYDLAIAKAEFKSAIGDLIIMSPNSDTALIAVLGDFFHADNNDASTPKSHNHLDVDGRHDKVLHLGTELIIWMVDMALQKHNKVIVHVTRGNHDPYASKALAMALWFRYENNPRVTIDRSPMDLWSYQWGTTMLSFTHGDNVKAEDMPGVMAAYEAVMWGATSYRFGYSGHYHKSKKSVGGDERHGAKWEILTAFTAADAWNRSMGHGSVREVTSITFDLERGRKSSIFVAV